MVAILTPKSKKNDQTFIEFDCGLILSLLCQIKQSSYVKGGTHPQCVYYKSFKACIELELTTFVIDDAIFKSY